MGVNVQSCNNLRQGNEIAYFMTAIKITDKNTENTTQSDHNSMWIRIKIDAIHTSIRKNKCPDRKLADEITIKNLLECMNRPDFIKRMEKDYKKNNGRLMKAVRNRERNT